MAVFYLRTFEPVKEYSRSEEMILEERHVDDVYRQQFKYGGYENLFSGSDIGDT
jgi:hypothetical protein